MKSGVRYLRFSWLIYYLRQLGVIFVAGGLLLITSYILFGLEFLQVDGSSMSPTLPNGSIVLMDKLSPRWRPLEVGDIVVIRNDQDQLVIKRVALDNTTQLIWSDQEGLYLPLLTSYVHLEPMVRQRLTHNLQLAPQELFILGDNQPISYDSRAYGPIARHQVIGKVIGTTDTILN